MFEAANIREWRGHDVVDAQDHKIGELEAVYVDTSTDLPSFGTVKVGMPTRHRLVFVPLDRATVGPGYLKVAYDKKQVKDAPSIDTDGELRGEEEYKTNRAKEYAGGNRHRHLPRVLFNPAVGPGTFFAAARSVGYRGAFTGFELHPQALAERDPARLTEADFEEVIKGDFIRATIDRRYPAIISNPPYIRHHRLTRKEKRELQTLARRWLGFPVDGRTGLHLYFLLKALEILEPEGRLAFLLPADVCEGVSSGRVWPRICARFRLEAVLTFSEAAAPFPRVDTNAMVFLLSNRPPTESFRWIRVEEPDSASILAALEAPPGGDDSILSRRLSEGLATGLSRPPRPEADGLPLSSFAKIVRGIATGANEFFFLTHKQLAEHGLSESHFVRAIGPDQGLSRQCIDPGTSR